MMTFFFVLHIGLKAEISSVHLVSPGLYVAMPQYKLAFPSSIEELDKFLDCVEALTTFVVSLKRNGKKCNISLIHFTL